MISTNWDIRSKKENSKNFFLIFLVFLGIFFFENYDLSPQIKKIKKTLSTINKENTVF